MSPRVPSIYKHIGKKIRGDLLVSGAVSSRLKRLRLPYCHPFVIVVQFVERHC